MQPHQHNYPLDNVVITVFFDNVVNADSLKNGVIADSLDSVINPLFINVINADSFDNVINADSFDNVVITFTDSIDNVIKADFFENIVNADFLFNFQDTEAYRYSPLSNCIIYLSRIVNIPLTFIHISLFGFRFFFLFLCCSLNIIQSSANQRLDSDRHSFKD